jgi:hypothetical protein
MHGPLNIKYCVESRTCLNSMAKNKTCREPNLDCAVSISSLVTAQTEVPDSQVNLLGTSVLRRGTSHVLHFFITVYINISYTLKNISFY